MVKEPDYNFKIIIIGPPAVGKTSLVNKFVERKFSADYLPTVGANVMVTQTTATVGPDEYYITLMIWDIAAQDTFKPMRPSFYHGAKGALLVGDLTDKPSIEALLKWDQELMKHLPGVPKILLGNKSDLKHTITLQDLQELGTKIHASEVLKTSALDGSNVKPAFQRLASQVIAQQLEKREMTRSKKDARVKSVIQYLYVLSKAGLVIFEHNFVQAEENGARTDGDLLGGALVAISELLKDVAKNNSSLKMVRQEGFSILMEEGTEIIVALVSTEESKPLRDKLLAFLKDFETSLGLKLHVYIEKGQVIPRPVAEPLVAKQFF